MFINKNDNFDMVTIKIVSIEWFKLKLIQIGQKALDTQKYFLKFLFFRLMKLIYKIWQENKTNYKNCITYKKHIYEKLLVFVLKPLIEK